MKTRMNNLQYPVRCDLSAIVGLVLIKCAILNTQTVDHTVFTLGGNIRYIKLNTADVKDQKHKTK